MLALQRLQRRFKHIKELIMMVLLVGAAEFEGLLSARVR
jgi:hypothetical protein